MLSAVGVRAQSIAQVQVDVPGSRELWVPTSIFVAEGDLVMVRAAGEVRLGPYYEPVDANGAPYLDYSGVLEAKIGANAPHRVGTAGCFAADHDGQVWLRVRDTRYGDNTGGYTAWVVHVPRTLIPEARIVRP